MVLPATLRVQVMYGPCSRGGSWWQGSFFAAAVHRDVDRSRQREADLGQLCLELLETAGGRFGLGGIRVGMYVGFSDIVPVSDAGYAVCGRLRFDRRGGRSGDRWLRPALGLGAGGGVRTRGVAAAAPATPARAKALLFAAGRLAAFAEQAGLELDEGLLCEAVIERFILVGCAGVSAATRRTLRTSLRALARATERYPQPLPEWLARERAKQPYTDAEIDGFLRLAAAQSSERRRMRSSALVCLGAGAGIVAGELRQVRGLDVVERAGGVLVVIAAAARARCRCWRTIRSRCCPPPGSPASA